MIKTFNSAETRIFRVLLRKLKVTFNNKVRKPKARKPQNKHKRFFLRVNLLFVFVPRCNGRVKDEFPGDEIILVVSLSRH